MSIVTKTGDNGTTGLMYNRRLSKSHPRIETYGSVDELNAAIGMARALSQPSPLADRLLSIQKQLVPLMGELATDPADLPRYLADGFTLVTADFIQPLSNEVALVESKNLKFDGWATPGANPVSAALDIARTTCRRAERRVHALQENEAHPNLNILIYLNRLSDLLWLLARDVETDASKHP